MARLPFSISDVRATRSGDPTHVYSRATRSPAASVALGSTAIYHNCRSDCVPCNIWPRYGSWRAGIASCRGLAEGRSDQKLHAASSSDEFQLGSEGVALVCVSYLDVGDASARIWAAIRRVRRQLPRATVLAGLWGPNNDQPGEIPAELNANLCARSFCEAAKLCIEAAAPGRRLPQASVYLQTLSAGS